MVGSQLHDGWTGLTTRIPVEAEVEDLDAVTIHLLVHVIDGYIDELEIYSGGLC